MRKIIFCVGAAALTACSSWALRPEVAAFRAPAITPQENVEGFLWLEAEGFANYGKWRLDTQFTHKMGSGYLIAQGALEPIGKAVTSIAVPRAGKWRVWARTKDWLPEFHPGTFRLLVDDRPGKVLGASGKDGWRWERAGEWSLDKGTSTIALEDLTGAFARCDALLFTTDLAYVPPDDAEGCEAARMRFGGVDPAVMDGGEFDLVVVGAGPGGMGVAIAAARHGARVALVHDRPLLGGNASSELGVPTDGAAVVHPNAREGGIVEEANLLRLRTPERTMSAAFAKICAELPNLTVFYNKRVLSAEKDGARIRSVMARDTLTGRRWSCRGRLFADCTGDGWLGVFAGAEKMYGREAKSEFNEEPAPEQRDDMTMSGCLMGNYLGYLMRRTGADAPFTPPAWADVLPPGFIRHVRNGNSQWWVEHGGRFDDLADPERARDELIRINVAYWGWLKNSWKGRDTLRNAKLSEIAYMNGRREGYRLTGDYILTANDCLQAKMFDDRISYGGWPLDTHDPLGMENPTGDGYWKYHPGVPIYSIPYRCLYSRNVSNLMMAGRCQSATHVALGSIRVESTLLTIGQAVGTAAAMMLAKGQEPRAFGADATNIRTLQQTLLKDDQYIPNVVNEDPLDRARGAKVSASSVCERIRVLRNNPIFAESKDERPLDMPRATGYLRGNMKELGDFDCMLLNGGTDPVEVTARVFAATASNMADRRLLGEVKATVPTGKRAAWVRFSPAKPIQLAGKYVWVQLQPVKDVTWCMAAKSLPQCSFLAWGYKTWGVVRNRRYMFAPVDGFTFEVDAKAEYVVDGVSRPVKDEWHGWRSDPEAGFPQTLKLELPQAEEIRQVRLTFDPDLNPLHPTGNPLPPRLVKSYVVEGFDGERWTTLAEEKDNGLRHRVHDFAPRRLKAVRLRVDSTWGDPSARVFEVRLY